MHYSYEIVKFNDKYPARILLQNKPQRRCNTGMHWHKCMEFIYIIEGRLGVQNQKDKKIINSGDIFFSNSEEMHASFEIEKEENVKYLVILLSVDYIRKFCDNIEMIEFDIENTKAYNSIPLKDAIKKNLVKISKLYEEKSKYNELHIFSELMNIYSLLFEYGLKTKKAADVESDNRNMHYIKKAVEYIGINYKEKVTLKDISNYIGLSESYFARYFKKITKTTFIQYLNIVRLEHALDDMINKNSSVTQAAYDNGFTDVKAFIEFCKKIYQVTPKQYINMNKKLT